MEFTKFGHRQNQLFLFLCFLMPDMYTLYWIANITLFFYYDYNVSLFLMVGAEHLDDLLKIIM